MRTYILILLVTCIAGVSSAQKIMRGTVFNDSIPLMTASIQIKNTTKGVTTDYYGNFEIETKIGDTLSVNYIGLNSKEHIVDAKNNIIVNLEGAFELEKVLIVGSVNYIKTHVTRCVTRYTRGCGTPCITALKRNNDFLKQQLIFPNPSPNGVFNLNLIKDYGIIKG